MFERNPTAPVRQRQTISVGLKLDDGRILAGRVAFSTGRTLADALNGQENFIEFEPFEGEREFLSKASLHSVRALQTPKAPQLDAPACKTSGLDPHAVLNVTKGTDPEVVRQAYLQRAKAYHPDRYANAELPEEVCRYLEAKARQVNMAYDLLQSMPRPPKAVTSQPIWQTSP